MCKKSYILRLILNIIIFIQSVTEDNCISPTTLLIILDIISTIHDIHNEFKDK